MYVLFLGAVEGEAVSGLRCLVARSVRAEYTRTPSLCFLGRTAQSSRARMWTSKTSEDQVNTAENDLLPPRSSWARTMSMGDKDHGREPHRAAQEIIIEDCRSRQ